MRFKDFFRLFTENLDSRIPFLLKKYKNQTEENIKQLALADPTSNNKYIDWIVKNSEQFRIPEDISKIKSTLEKFVNQSKTKKWQGSKDINTYKSYKELIQQIESNADITNIEPVQQTQDHTDKKIKIKEENGFTIYKVTDAETIKEIAKGTEWCVRDEPYASDYLKKGPYFVIYKEWYKNETIHKDKNGNVVVNPVEGGYSYEIPQSMPTPFILIHYPTGQIKDKYDSPINTKTAEEIYPLIQNSFKNVKFNYEEGIGDFEAFLNRQKNKGANGSIAQGSDKEILEKYSEPQNAYNTLYYIKNISESNPLKLRKLKESIGKSSKLTLNYLTNLRSLYTHNRDFYMEQKLLEHNKKQHILKYGSTLINAACSIGTTSFQRKLRDILNYYAYSNNIVYKNNVDNFFKKYNLSFSDILINVVQNPKLKEFSDIRKYIYNIADENTDAITEYERLQFLGKL